MVSYPKVARTKWVREWPGQAILAVTQYYWTANVHESIKGGQQVKILHYFSKFSKNNSFLIKLFVNKFVIFYTLFRN